MPRPFQTKLLLCPWTSGQSLPMWQQELQIIQGTRRGEIQSPLFCVNISFSHFWHPFFNKCHIFPSAILPQVTRFVALDQCKLCTKSGHPEAPPNFPRTFSQNGQTSNNYCQFLFSKMSPPLNNNPWITSIHFDSQLELHDLA